MQKIFCLVLVLLVSVGVFAQENTIQKEEFESVRIKGFAKYADKFHRRVETSQNLEGISNYTKSVMEFAMPIGSRMLFDSNSLKRETVKFGGVTYTKINNGAWKTETPEIKSRPQNYHPIVDSRIEYKYLGKELLNDQNTNVYQTIETQKRVNSSDGRETFSTITTKYWFGADDAILKQETEMESRIKNANTEKSDFVSRHLRTTIWEIDANIKIEAPALNYLKENE